MASASDLNVTETGEVPRYPFVHVDVAPDDADETSALLFELGAAGVEERDGTTLNKGSEGKTTLVASFATRAEAELALESLDPALAPRIEEIVGDAWRDAWKEHFRPFAIARGVVIRPPWEEYSPAPSERVLELEPGRAFGSGLHETTALVAETLERHASAYRGLEVLDVGCGSGILGLVALVLGAKRVVCIDNDPDVIDVVKENAERNGFGSDVMVDTTDVADVTATFPMVVANIEAHVLIPMAEVLSKRLAARGLLVLSGVLDTQRDSVIAAYPDLETVETTVRGEWVAITLRKP